MTKEVDVAGAIIVNQNLKKIVIVNQNNNSFSLPKGHVDLGETFLQAAKREVQEETGLTELTFIKELGSYKRYKISLDGNDDLSELKKITMFLFSTIQENLNPTDPHNPEALWLDKGQVSKYLTHRKDIEFFLSVVETLPLDNL